MPRLPLLSLFRRPPTQFSAGKNVRNPWPVRSVSTLPNLPLFQALRNHEQDSPAVVHGGSNRSFTYGNLVADVLGAKEKIAQITGVNAVPGERVAFLAENSYDYVGTVVFRVALCETMLILKSHFCLSWPAMRSPSRSHQPSLLAS